MKQVFLIITIFIALSGCNSQDTSDTKRLNIVEFNSAITKDNVQLIDVRTPKECEQGHIPNAIVIDYFADDFITKAKTLDKNKSVYLYCRSGKRSAKASKKLQTLGFTQVYDLEGGYLKWSKEHN